MKNEYYEGFSWAIPLAFSDALGAFRFEQGDTLHDSVYAYEKPWGEALTMLKYSIQVVSPMRGSGQKVRIGDASTLANNWSLPVVFNLIHHKSNKSEEIRTTQGHLYLLLWKGDVRVVKSNQRIPLPLSAMQVFQRIQEDGVIERFVAPDAVDLFRRTVLVIPYDPVNSLLASKREKIRGALKKLEARECIILPPECSDPVLPTARLACYFVEGSRRNELEDLVKKTVYVSSQDKKTDRDNFRISAHGHLFEV
jgi:hypothetical protein